MFLLKKHLEKEFPQVQVVYDDSSLFGCSTYLDVKYGKFEVSLQHNKRWLGWLLGRNSWWVHTVREEEHEEGYGWVGYGAFWGASRCLKRILREAVQTNTE